MPADEVLGLLRQATTAAAGCRALARCGDSSADAHSNLLEALVEALQLHGPVDAAVARHGCTALDIAEARDTAGEAAEAAVAQAAARPSSVGQSSQTVTLLRQWKELSGLAGSLQGAAPWGK